MENNSGVFICAGLGLAGFISRIFFAVHIIEQADCVRRSPAIDFVFYDDAVGGHFGAVVLGVLVFSCKYRLVAFVCIGRPDGAGALFGDALFCLHRLAVLAAHWIAAFCVHGIVWFYIFCRSAGTISLFRFYYYPGRAVLFGVFWGLEEKKGRKTNFLGRFGAIAVSVLTCLPPSLFPAVDDLNTQLQKAQLLSEKDKQKVLPYTATYMLSPGQASMSGKPTKVRRQLSGTMKEQLLHDGHFWTYAEEGQFQFLDDKGQLTPVSWAYQTKEAENHRTFSFSFVVKRGKDVSFQTEGKAVYDPLLQRLRITWLKPFQDTVILEHKVLFPLGVQKTFLKALDGGAFPAGFFFFDGRSIDLLPSMSCQLEKPIFVKGDQNSFLVWPVDLALFREKKPGGKPLPFSQRRFLLGRGGLCAEKTLFVDGEVVRCQYKGA